MSAQDEDEDGEVRPGSEEPAPDAAAPAAEAAGKGTKKGQDIRAMSRVDLEARTCEAALTVPLDAPKVLMLKLVEQAAAETLLRATPGKDLTNWSLY